MDVVLANASVFALPGFQRAGAIVYDGTIDLDSGVRRGPIAICFTFYGDTLSSVLAKERALLSTGKLHSGRRAPAPGQVALRLFDLGREPPPARKNRTRRSARARRRSSSGARRARARLQARYAARRVRRRRRRPQRPRSLRAARGARARRATRFARSACKQGISDAGRGDAGLLAEPGRRREGASAHGPPDQEPSAAPVEAPTARSRRRSIGRSFFALGGSARDSSGGASPRRANVRAGSIRTRSRSHACVPRPMTATARTSKANGSSIRRSARVRSSSC